MADTMIKRVERRLVVGPRGLPVVENGYTEIGGVRTYDDMLVVGPDGLPVIQRGRTEIVGDRT